MPGWIQETTQFSPWTGCGCVRLFLGPACWLIPKLTRTLSRETYTALAGDVSVASDLVLATSRAGLLGPVSLGTVVRLLHTGVCSDVCRYVVLEEVWRDLNFQPARDLLKSRLAEISGRM